MNKDNKKRDAIIIIATILVIVAFFIILLNAQDAAKQRKQNNKSNDNASSYAADQNNAETTNVPLPVPYVPAEPTESEKQSYYAKLDSVKKSINISNLEEEPSIVWHFPSLMVQNHYGLTQDELDTYFGFNVLPNYLPVGTDWTYVYDGNYGLPFVY